MCGKKWEGREALFHGSSSKRERKMCQNSTEENKRRSERGVWEEVGG